MLINSLPSDKFLNLSKLNAFENNKINVTEKLKFVCARVEIIVGKGENAFSRFPTMFSKPSFLGSLKVRIVW